MFGLQSEHLNPILKFSTVLLGMLDCLLGIYRTLLNMTRSTKTHAPALMNIGFRTSSHQRVASIDLTV